MKWFVVLLLFAALSCLPKARAQSLDDQYVQIFNVIQEADTLSSTAPGQALAKYLEAQTALQAFQKGNPDWNAKIVGFRLSYVSSKIATLSANTPPITVPGTKIPPNVAEPTVSRQSSAADSEAHFAELNGQITMLREQVRQLQAEKVLLQSKLKEALAMQPAESDPREFARAQEKISALQKENELLKLTIDKEKSKPAASANTSEVAGLRAENQELRKQLEQTKPLASKEPATPKSKTAAAPMLEVEQQLLIARARLAALESRATPYSPEELALMKRPETKLTASEPDSGKKSVKELPPGAANLVKEAQTYFAAKQYEQAEGAYVQVLRLAPNNVAALANLAAIQVEAQHFDAAEKNLQQALAVEPENSYTLYVLGLLRFRQAKYDAALDAFSHCAKLDPQNAEIQNYLGLALSEKGFRVPAEAALRKAIQLQPGYAGAHYNLAIIYMSQKPPALELARWHYQKAIAAGQPHNSELEKKFASAAP